MLFVPGEYIRLPPPPPAPSYSFLQLSCAPTTAISSHIVFSKLHCSARCFPIISVNMAVYLKATVTYGSLSILLLSISYS